MSMFSIDREATLKDRLRATGKGGVQGLKVSLMGLGIVLIGLIAYLNQPKRIFPNTTVSLPAGLYYYVPGDVFDLHEGDLIRFNYVAPRWVRDRHWTHKKESDTYLKKIAGVPGDRIVLNGREVSICPQSGLPCEVVAKRMETDRYGDAWPPLDIGGVIPEDKFFVVGTHPASFDSRYYGYVDRSQFLGKAKGVWVEPQKEAIFTVDWDEIVRDEVPKRRAERERGVTADE